MVEDLWILMKRPMVTNQSLNDISDVLFVKAMWHSYNKEMKMRISIIGSAEDARIKVD